MYLILNQLIPGYVMAMPLGGGRRRVAPNQCGSRSASGANLSAFHATIPFDPTMILFDGPGITGETDRVSAVMFRSFVAQYALSPSGATIRNRRDQTITFQMDDGTLSPVSTRPPERNPVRSGLTRRFAASRVSHVHPKSRTLFEVIQAYCTHYPKHAFRHEAASMRHLQHRPK